MTIATVLQARIAAPTAVSANDFMGVFQQAMTFVNGIVPPIVHIAYLFVIVFILFEIWKTKGFKGWARMEMIGLAIAFGLMR